MKKAQARANRTCPTASPQIPPAATSTWPNPEQQGAGSYRAKAPSLAASAFGFGNGRLPPPRGLTVGSDQGTILVADSGNSRIEEWAPGSAPTYTTSFAQPEPTEAKFGEPTAVAMSPTTANIEVINSAPMSRSCSSTPNTNTSPSSANRARAKASSPKASPASP